MGAARRGGINTGRTVVVVGLGGERLPHEGVGGEVVDAGAEVGDVAFDFEFDVLFRVPAW